MPLPYQRTPFNSNRPVFISNECHEEGARDIGFNGIRWGEPVYAVEPGTVVSVNRNSSCFSQIDPNNPNRAIPPSTANCIANFVVIRGSDGFFTEYAHVFPRPEIVVGTTVPQGFLIGNIDRSGRTTGPHVHLARYLQNLNYIPNPNALPADFGYRNGGWTCNWTMNGLVPLGYTGWWQWSGRWFYIINGSGYRTGPYTIGNTVYEFDNIGAWTGWFTTQGNTYFRTQNGFGPLKTGWLCWRGTWFYFYNNGIRATNTMVGQFQFNSDGACTNCQQYPCQ